MQLQDGYRQIHGRRECRTLGMRLLPKPLQKVLNSHRSHERTFVQPNLIAFPGINAPEGVFHSSCGPKDVARKVTAIRSIVKDISELVSLLISLPRDGERITRQHNYPLECPP